MGRPLSGVVGVAFAIYKDQQGGSPLWVENQNVRSDNGNYTALLGSYTEGGFPTDILSSTEPRWLGVRFQTDDIEQPRVMLVSVPYALKAADADTLGGKPLSAFVLSDPPADKGSTSAPASKGKTGKDEPTVNAITNPGTAGCLAKYDSNGTDIVESTLCQQNGKTGVGVANPAYSLHVSGTPGITNLYVGTGNLYIADGNFDVQGTADITTRVQSNGPGHAASFQLNSGNGTTSGRYAYFRMQALEAQPQEWRVGMYGSKDLGFYNWTVSTSVPAIFVKAADNKLGMGTTTPAEKLDVVGNIKSSGQLISTVATGTAPLVVNSTTQVANLNASFIGGMSAAAARTRGIVYLAGCDNCSPLTNGDNQKAIYFNVIGPMTIDSVTCFSDAGSPSINIKRDDGSPANILSSTLTCSPSGTTSTSFAVGENVLNLNEKLDFVMVSADGTARRVTVSIRALVN